MVNSLKKYPKLILRRLSSSAGFQGEPGLLASAYRSSLEVAQKNGIRTIAFPSISTGVYSYPIDAAARVAIKTVKDFENENPDTFVRIVWVLFDEHTKMVYDRILKVL